MNTNLEKFTLKDRIIRVWYWFRSYSVLINANEHIKKGECPDCDAMVWNTFKESKNIEMRNDDVIRFGCNNRLEFRFFSPAGSDKIRPNSFRVRMKNSSSSECWVSRATMAYMIIKTKKSLEKHKTVKVKEDAEKLKNAFYENFVDEKGL